MKNKQLLYLFLSNLIILFVGMGLFPLLPLYATDFGATPTVVGFYFAFTYVSNAAGTMLTGPATRLLTRKGAFVASAALGIPALFLLGRAGALWQVFLLTGLLWFSGGMGVALANVFTGLHANGRQRGASFSLMYLGFPLGSLLGGAMIGRLVDTSGYPAMFTALAVLWTALPLVVLLGVKDKEVSGGAVHGKARQAQAATAAAKSGGSALDRQFHLLLLVTLLSSMAISASRLGAPMSMQALRFSAGAIASTATVSGLATIPIVLVFGRLSDRLGRERFLKLAYGLTATGALTLIVSTQLWHFWVAATLMMVALCASGAMASALATDVLPAEALSQGLPWVKGMGSVAGIVSFAGTGLVLDTVGGGALFVGAAALALAAIVSLSSLQAACRETARKSTLWHSWTSVLRRRRGADVVC
ncbi:MAG TPA: MFS transporter [Candidatus Sulfomarinibacteraceae bacterium]|nr:MFS transporter [Candidatus Sulfomarinibacteraceae bacterium]